MQGRSYSSTTSSRFNSCGQDCRWQWALTPVIKLIEILKYCSKFLTLKESFYFSVEIQKWKNYVLWKYSLWRAACNCKFSLSCLQPSDISSHSQDPYRTSYDPSGKCFLWTFFFPSEAPQVQRWARGMLERLRDVLIHGGRITYRNLTWFTKWNKTAEVNEPGFILTIVGRGDWLWNSANFKANRE